MWPPPPTPPANPRNSDRKNGLLVRILNYHEQLTLSESLPKYYISTISTLLDRCIICDDHRQSKLLFVCGWSAMGGGGNICTFACNSWILKAPSFYFYHTIFANCLFTCSNFLMAQRTPYILNILIKKNLVKLSNAPRLIITWMIKIMMGTWEISVYWLSRDYSGPIMHSY